MWSKGINRYQSALQIKDHAKKSRIGKTQNELRQAIKIAIIDDEQFKPRSNLESYGYRFDELQDIRSIEQVREYDIILCDLMGVGHNFDSAIGGASVIKEIKLNYPVKFIIAYTGARSNSAEANAAREYADLHLKKDIEISSWVQELDAAIDFSLDPYQRWVITRQGLLDFEVDLREIVKLEDAYVTSISQGDSKLEAFRHAIGVAQLSGHAKAIAQSLAASVIYGILFS